MMLEVMRRSLLTEESDQKEKLGPVLLFLGLGANYMVCLLRGDQAVHLRCGAFSECMLE